MGRHEARAGTIRKDSTETGKEVEGRKLNEQSLAG